MMMNKTITIKYTYYNMYISSKICVYIKCAINNKINKPFTIIQKLWTLDYFVFTIL